jgi:hypothetical protein
MSETYKEKVLRYRVLRRPVITDPSIRAEYRLNDLDPDDCWSLIWSFNNEVDAIAQAEEEREIFKEERWIIKVVDAGSETIIERPIW